MVLWPTPTYSMRPNRCAAYSHGHTTTSIRARSRHCDKLCIQCVIYFSLIESKPQKGWPTETVCSNISQQAHLLSGARLFEWQARFLPIKTPPECRARSRPLSAVLTLQTVRHKSCLKLETEIHLLWRSDSAKLSSLLSLWNLSSLVCCLGSYCWRLVWNLHIGLFSILFSVAMYLLCYKKRMPSNKVILAVSVLMYAVGVPVRIASWLFVCKAVYWNLVIAYLCWSPKSYTRFHRFRW